jgi:hypothetical protein
MVKHFCFQGCQRLPPCKQGYTLDTLIAVFRVFGKANSTAVINRLKSTGSGMKSIAPFFIARTAENLVAVGCHKKRLAELRCQPSCPEVLVHRRPEGSNQELSTLVCHRVQSPYTPQPS